MALIDEMFDDMNEDFDSRCKKQVEDRISQTQSFFRKYNITRWRFVFVDFGEQLLKDYNGNYYKDNDTFSLSEMKKSRGYIATPILVENVKKALKKMFDL